MDAWSSTILDWVNCLELIDTTVNNLLELQDGKFFGQFIEAISKQKKYDCENPRDLVLQFIKDNYPEFMMENKSDGSQEIYLASLLLLHATEEPKLHQPMCNKLNVETQVKIKTFLEKVLCFGNNITRQNIHAAIMDMNENIIRTPPMTPKRRPLRDFLNSPATSTAKNFNRVMSERSREVQRLKWELEIEKFEKADLEEDLKNQQLKIQSLQIKLEEKNAELKKIRDDSLRRDSPRSCKKKRDEASQIYRLNAEVRTFEELAGRLRVEIDNLEDEKMLLKRKLNSTEKQCSMLKETSELNARNLETMTIQVQLKDQKLEELQFRYEDLREHLQEVQRASTVDQSFEMEPAINLPTSPMVLNTSEALSSIIEIQLQEEKKHSSVLKAQLEEQIRKLESLKNEYETSLGRNRNLEAEKVRLLDECEAFRADISSKEKLLEVSAQKHDELTAEFHGLETKMESLLDSLEKQNEKQVESESRINDLESEKAEMLENASRLELAIQVSNETILEQGRLFALKEQELLDIRTELNRNIEAIATLEKEKMILEEKSSSLDLCLSSTRESLEQCHRKIESLTLELTDVNDKLADVQRSLELESNKVEELESVIVEMRLDNKQTLEKQLAAYQTLYSEKMNLEDIKSDLTEEAVHLKTTLSETKKLLVQSQQKNVHFESELDAIRNDAAQLEASLSQERITVKNLDDLVNEIRLEKSRVLEANSLKYQDLHEKYSNLEKTKLNLLADIEGLKVTLVTANESLEQSQQENANLLSDMTKLKDNISKIKATLHIEKQRVEDLESTNARLQLEKEESLNAQLAKYQILERENMDLKKVRAELSANTKSLKELVSLKEKLISDSLQTNSDLETSLSSMKNNIVSLENFLSEKTDTIEKLETKIIETRSTYEDSMKTQDRKYELLQQQYSTMEQQTENLRIQIKELKSCVNSKEESLDQFQQQIVQYESDVSDLKSKLTNLESSLSAERTNAEKLDALLARTLLENEESSKTQSMTYQSLETKYSNLEQEKLHLLKEKDNLHSLIVSKDELVQQLREQILQLESNQTAIEKELTVAEAVLSYEKTRSNDLELEVEKIKLEKETSLADQMSTYRNLSQKYSELEKIQSDLFEKNASLEATLLTKTDLVEEFEQKNVKLETELLALRNKISATESSLNESSIRIKNLESVVAQTQLEKDSALETEAMRYKDLQQATESLKSEITLLKIIEHDLFEAREQLGKQSEDMKNLNEQKSCLLDKIHMLEADTLSKNDLLAESHKLNENLQITINDVTNEVDSLKKSLHLEQDKVISLKSDIAIIESEKVETLETIERLKTQIADYEILIDDSSSILKSLTEKLAVLAGGELPDIADLSILSLCKQHKTMINTLEQIRVSDLTKFEVTTSELNSTVTKLKADLAHHEEMKIQADHQISEYFNENKKLKVIAEEKQILVQSVDELRMQLRDKDATISSLDEKIEVYVTSLHQLHVMIKLLKEGQLELTKSVQIQNQDVTSQLTNINKTVMELHKQNQIDIERSNALNEEMILLSREYDEEKKSRMDIQNKYHCLESNHACAQKSSHQLRTSLESEVVSLSSDLNEAKERCILLEKERQQTTQTLRNLGFSIDELIDLIRDSHVNLNVANKNPTSNLHVKDVTVELTNSSNMSVQNLLEFINGKIDSSRSSISHLLYTVKEVENLLGDERKRSENLKSAKSELELKIKNLENWSTKFEHDLKMVIETKTALHDYVTQIMSSRDNLTTKFVTLKSKLEHTQTLTADIFTKNKSVCDELKHLKSRNESLEKTVSDMYSNFMDGLQPIADVMSSVFLWTEQQLEQRYSNAANAANQSVEIRADDEFFNAKSILGKEIERNAGIETKITATLNDIQRFIDSVNSYTTSLNLGQIKHEPTLEENLKKQLDMVSKERKDLKDKLDLLRVRNAKLEKNLDELRKEVKKLETAKLSEDNKSQLEELRSRITKLECENEELITQNAELNKRSTNEDFDKRLKEVHFEYDQKLDKIKQKMKTAYNDQIAKVNAEQERILQEKLANHKQRLEEQCRKHAEDITKYKEHVEKLTSDYWDVGEKLLLEQQQKELITHQLQELKKRLRGEKMIVENSSILQAPTSRSKTTSLDRREFGSNMREKSSNRTTIPIKEEPMASYEKHDTMKNARAMQAMGNIFKAEDEEGEVFNTNYLADMKAGRCVPSTDVDRLSVLQARNSLCKPHLKSSYPAETQFQPLTFTEEDIKSGGTADDIFNDSLSQSLLPGEKTKKRDRTQTLYKRPGPPTPSKNGGRLSLQGNELKSPGSRILREQNVERRSTATPRRLMDLFGGSRRQDENVTGGTPKGRRLSNIFRKPR